MRPLAGREPSDRPARVWPRARVVLPRTVVERPAYPVIDVHQHLGRWLAEDGSFLAPAGPDLAALLDAVGLACVINLDGRWGEELTANVARFDAALPGRVRTFCHLDWDLLLLGDEASPECARALTEQLADSAGRGARGVKVWKDLGLTRRDATGELVRVDDARVVAALRSAGELGLPVLIHTADPVAFFDPLDESNERWDELAEMPSWWFGGPGFPSFEELIGQLHGLVGACPGTTFVGAHVGGHAEDLGAVGAALARLPNFHVDTGGRLGELGRQPRAFRRLVEAFPDRVLFGSDSFPIDPGGYPVWWRFLETDDEHFDYGPEDEPPSQGNWRISGCGLPSTVLRAVYHDNAARVLAL